MCSRAIAIPSQILYLTGRWHRIANKVNPQTWNKTLGIQTNLIRNVVTRDVPHAKEQMLGLGLACTEWRERGRGALYLIAHLFNRGSATSSPRCSHDLWAGPQNSLAADLKLALAMDYLLFALCT